MAAKFDRALLILAGVFGLIALVIAWDFLAALNAEACGSPGAGANCYPWGAEGPFADDWKYSSKSAYLMSSVAFLATVSLTLIIVSPAIDREMRLPKWSRLATAALLLVSASILWI